MTKKRMSNQDIDKGIHDTMVAKRKSLLAEISRIKNKAMKKGTNRKIAFDGGMEAGVIKAEVNLLDKRIRQWEESHAS